MSKVRFNKKTKMLRERADELGYAYEYTGGGHLKFTHPLVPKPIFGASTPSCIHGHKNCMQLLERALREARPAT